MEESQYYILYNDGTKSMPHSLDELSCIKDITKETLIIKDNNAPKPAAAFIDFTDNRQTRLPDELNTLNIGACVLAPLWGYNNLPKYKVYWAIYITIIILLLLFSAYLLLSYYYLPNIKSRKLFGIALPLAYFVVISYIPASVMSILYLVKGNEIAWRNRKFKDIKQFKDIQEKWNKWGYYLCGPGVLCIILLQYVIFNIILVKPY